LPWTERGTEQTAREAQDPPSPRTAPPVRPTPTATTRDDPMKEATWVGTPSRLRQRARLHRPAGQQGHHPWWAAGHGAV